MAISLVENAVGRIRPLVGTLMHFSMEQVGWNSPQTAVVEFYSVQFATLVNLFFGFAKVSGKVQHDGDVCFPWQH